MPGTGEQPLTVFPLPARGRKRPATVRQLIHTRPENRRDIYIREDAVLRKFLQAPHE